jgi:hypothetical protein
MTNSNNANLAPKLVHIEASNTPLVAPKDVKGGKAGNKGDTANEKAAALNAWAVKALEKNSESLAVKAVMKAACQTAVADYYKAVEETSSDAAKGLEVAEVVEEAKSNVARAFADAILANVFDRSEARSQLGTAFGFEVSDKTGKPTSKPVEPGNTIAKRISSVTIAAEYAMSGQLPDRGGESLPIVGQEKVQELLEDYFSGDISVRAASERIEKAIRDERVSTPLEMDADKIIRLAGKIQTASEKIAGNSELREAYTALFQIVASIPFPLEMEEAA